MFGVRGPNFTFANFKPVLSSKTCLQHQVTMEIFLGLRMALEAPWVTWIASNDLCVHVSGLFGWFSAGHVDDPWTRDSAVRRSGISICC